MEITGGEIKYNNLSEKSSGGTEELGRELHRRMPKELLKEFQIILSRVREIDDSKVRIFWAHDLPGDPESKFLEDKSKHNLFHKYVFVSNWQQQAYIQAYDLPWSKCMVLQNAIVPIGEHKKPKKGVNLIYTSTPHRGLEILVPVFDRLAGKYDDLHLDVFSSFEIYGWKQRDAPYEKLFEAIKKHPKMTYHGFQPNDKVREALKQSHILAYPSIWPETSCMVLMEAMSAGLLCVHSNFAALPETAANWTMMYGYHENPNIHASIFYHVLDTAINNLRNENVQSRIETMKSYADVFYNWDHRERHWRAALESTLAQVGDDRAPPKAEKEMFSYKPNA